jgi:hypothetical protein
MMGIPTIPRKKMASRTGKPAPRDFTKAAMVAKEAEARNMSMTPPWSREGLIRLCSEFSISPQVYIFLFFLERDDRAVWFPFRSSKKT